MFSPPGTFSVRAAWDEFARNVLTPDASGDLREHTRRTFYCGAAAMLEVLTRIGSREVPPPRGQALADAVAAEVADFLARLGTPQG